MTENYIISANSNIIIQSSQNSESHIYAYFTLNANFSVSFMRKQNQTNKTEKQTNR